MPAIVHVAYCVYILRKRNSVSKKYTNSKGQYMVDPTSNCGLPPFSPFLSNNKKGYDLFNCFNFVGDDAEFW